MFPNLSYLSIAKWAGIGVALLALCWFVGEKIVEINTWHANSDKLPAVIAERDQAITAKQELEKYAVGAFDHIEKGINGPDGLNVKWANFYTSYMNTGAAIDAAVTNFREATANVPNAPAPGSPDDQLLRDRLLDILANPDTHQLGRGPGPDESGAGAGVPGTVAPPRDLPGRRPAAADQQGMVVPGAGGSHRSGAKRTAQGHARGRVRLGAKRTGGKVRPEQVGSAVPKVRLTVRVDERVKRCIENTGLRPKCVSAAVMIRTAHMRTKRNG
jgi:hypothetical protein